MNIKSNGLPKGFHSVSLRKDTSVPATDVIFQVGVCPSDLTRCKILHEEGIYMAKVARPRFDHCSFEVRLVTSRLGEHMQCLRDSGRDMTRPHRHMNYCNRKSTVKDSGAHASVIDNSMRKGIRAVWYEKNRMLVNEIISEILSP